MMQRRAAPGDAASGAGGQLQKMWCAARGAHTERGALLQLTDQQSAMHFATTADNLHPAGLDPGLGGTWKGSTLGVRVSPEAMRRTKAKQRSVGTRFEESFIT
jgi:hypothetical protein